MKFSLPQVTVLSLVLFSVTAVISAPIPPPNEFEEALEGLLGLADETRATQPPANARPQAPPPQPHQREPQADGSQPPPREPPSYRGSGLPGNKRLQAPDYDDRLFYGAFNK
ncbi:uncharacterized protein UBRO_20734 [Ustilago bromivora]|uniref:Uncharacterized protein n=1 Tax=Ustilago bromivora TaxID=307758 RepID=A0A1K0H951_9BASI|nr:uncharacterized protein UBRO_20734 [Ustilago bromivora]SYW86264.1 uncharacterized protein UBRO2_05984 [Ustilago bromivora]